MWRARRAWQAEKALLEEHSKRADQQLALASLDAHERHLLVEALRILLQCVQHTLHAHEPIGPEGRPPGGQAEGSQQLLAVSCLGLGRRGGERSLSLQPVTQLGVPQRTQLLRERGAVARRQCAQRGHVAASQPQLR